MTGARTPFFEDDEERAEYIRRLAGMYQDPRPPEYIAGMRIFRYRPPALEATATSDPDGTVVHNITTL